MPDNYKPTHIFVCICGRKVDAVCHACVIALKNNKPQPQGCIDNFYCTDRCKSTK